MSNDGWGKGWLTEGVSTEPKWPDEAKFALAASKVEWDEHQEINGGVNPHAVGIKSDQIELDGQTIPARIVGDLAIHDSVGSPDHFCITHIPTLTEFMKAVPVEQDQEYEQYELVDWCERVQQKHHLFWQVLSELTSLTFNRNTARDMRAKDIIKEWCLSVPIKNKEW